MGNFHVKPKMDAPVPAPPPAPKAKVSNTQAGAVAELTIGTHEHDWGIAPSPAMYRLPAGEYSLYTAPPAAVPVGWRWLWADGSRASEWFDGLPTEAAIRNGAEKGAHVEYLTPPAAVLVEALEGLVAKWREEAVAIRARATGRWAAMTADDARSLEKRADELTQLIKERSNG